MDSIDVLTIRPPAFFTSGITASIYPEEIFPSTYLDNNSISSRLLNADFLHHNRKITLYPDIDDYIFLKERLKRFLKEKNLKWKYVRKNILKLDPKIIFILVRSISNFSSTLKVAEIAKRVNPEIKVGVWKAGNEFHQHSMSLKYLKNRCIDFVVIGEPEYTILEVSKNLLKRKGVSKIKGLVIRNKDNKIIFTGKRRYEYNLNNLPIPNRDLILDKKYYPPSSFGFVEGGRGCTYRCNYCIWGGIPFRLRDPRVVIREIMQVYTKYGTREFYFIMSSFLHSRKWAREICNFIRKFKLDIVFKIYANLNQIDKKIIKELKSAGCISLCVGLESGDFTTLKSMNKISNLNLEKVKKAIETIKSSGIFLRTGVIIGNPDENLEQMMNSIQIIKEVKPDFFRVQFLVPMPGTSFYEKSKSMKMLIDENLDEYLTSEIKIKQMVDVQTLKSIWTKYAKLSDLSDSIVLRKKFLNCKFLKCKIFEYIRYLKSITS